MSLPLRTRRPTGPRAGPRSAAEPLEARALLSVQLVSLAVTTGTLPFEMVDVGGTVFFNGHDPEHGTELWKTDGTAAGTVLVKDLFPGTNTGQVTQLRNVGGTLMFYANTAEAGDAIWKSDGTAAGTVIVSDPVPGPGFALIRDLTSAGGRLYYMATVGDTSALYQTDATPGSTRQITTVSDFTGDPTASGARVFWTQSGALRLYDPGLDSVYTVHGQPGFPNNLTDVNGTLYFTADHPSSGAELWKVSNSTVSASRVKDINPGTAASYPADLANVNGTLYFYADGGAGQRGLWKSNGTSAGTTFVKQISGLNFTTAAGGLLYFYGKATFDDPAVLWKSDGTAAGTIPLGGPDPFELTAAGSALYFRAAGELWRSDGTPSGTRQVADLNPTTGSNPGDLTVSGSHLYFAAAADYTARHVWRATLSGGATVAGTVFNDFDGDGARDATDNPLPGRTVYSDADNDGVLDPAEWRTVTDAAGVYRLDGLAAGAHRVRMTLPPRWRQTAPAGGAAHSVTLAATQTVTGRNFSAQGTAPTVVASQYMAGANMVFVDFTEDVRASFGIDDLVVRNLDTGQFVPASAMSLGGVGFAPAGFSQNAVAFAFDNSQPAGRYSATLRAAGVATAEGYRVSQDYAFTFNVTGRLLGQRLFYNNSAFDGGDPAPTAADDAAIATDKSALSPFDGAVRATFSNYTTYSRGINGVMIDLVALPAAARLSADDFEFHTGNGPNIPDWAWTRAPAPAAVSLRRGAAAAGTFVASGGDRAMITWSDGAIRNTWLRVTVKATPDTGLAQPRAFTFGNLVGDAGPRPRDFFPFGRPLSVDARDLARTRAAVSPAAANRLNVFDFNRDGRVNAADVLVARLNHSQALHADVTRAAPPPPAPALAAAAASVAAASRGTTSPRGRYETVSNPAEPATGILDEGYSV